MDLDRWSSLFQEPLTRPARRVQELSKDKLGAREVGCGACQHCNADDGEASDAPRKRRLVDVRQDMIAESIEQERKGRVANVDEKLLPALGLIRGVIERNHTDNQLGAEQPTSGRESDFWHSVSFRRGVCI